MMVEFFDLDFMKSFEEFVFGFFFNEILIVNFINFVSYFF